MRRSAVEANMRSSVDEHVFGVKARARSVATGAALLREFYGAEPRHFAWRQPPYEYEHDKMPIDILAGSDVLRKQVESGVAIGEIAASWADDEAEFLRLRSSYLLY